MLYKEKIAVCSEIHTEHITALAQGVSMNVRPGGTYSTHWTSNGLTGCSPVSHRPPVKTKDSPAISEQERGKTGAENEFVLLFSVTAAVHRHEQPILRALSCPPHIPTVPLITFLSTGCCHLQQHNLNLSSNTTSSWFLPRTCVSYCSEQPTKMSVFLLPGLAEFPLARLQARYN